MPRAVGALARGVQGLLIHEHMTEAYGVKLSPERHAEAHVRPLEAMLDRIVIEPFAMTPEEFATFDALERAKSIEVAREANVTLE